MTLEDKISGTKGGTKRFLDKIAEGYDYMYEHYPKTTKYLSSAIGTIGGDIIAKQFTEDPNVEWRDIGFTSIAAIPYSYLAPKMIEWSTKITDKLGEYERWRYVKTDKKGHDLLNAVVLTALYFPVNMIYWNYLTIKNQAPINLESNLIGAFTLSMANIPYLIADYYAIKKFSQSSTQKYLRLFYSAVEIGWNTLFAGGNYIAKRV